MLTVAYNDVLFRAAELAGRTRDKIPPTEARMMQGYLAVDLQAVWNAHEWPELVPDPAQLTPVARHISKNEDQTALAMIGMVATLGDGTPLVYVTTTVANALVTRDSVTMTGLTGVLASANGTWVVTVTDSTHFNFTVPALNTNLAAAAIAGVNFTGLHFQIGDVLGVTSNNPVVTTRYREIGFDETDNTIRIAEDLASVWVEFVLPRPDLMHVADADLATYKLPARFSNYLALRAAGLLLKSDGQDAAATTYLALAEQALAAEIRRTPIPERRSHARVRNSGRPVRFATNC